MRLDQSKINTEGCCICFFFERKKFCIDLNLIEIKRIPSIDGVRNYVKYKWFEKNNKRLN